MDIQREPLLRKRNAKKEREFARQRTEERNGRVSDDSLFDSSFTANRNHFFERFQKRSLAREMKSAVVPAPGLNRAHTFYRVPHTTPEISGHPHLRPSYVFAQPSLVLFQLHPLPRRRSSVLITFTLIAFLVLLDAALLPHPSSQHSSSFSPAVRSQEQSRQLILIFRRSLPPVPTPTRYSFCKASPHPVSLPAPVVSSPRPCLLRLRFCLPFLPFGLGLSGSKSSSSSFPAPPAPAAPPEPSIASSSSIAQCRDARISSC